MSQFPRSSGDRRRIRYFRRRSTRQHSSAAIIAESVLLQSTNEAGPLVFPNDGIVQRRGLSVHEFFDDVS